MIEQRSAHGADSDGGAGAPCAGLAVVVVNYAAHRLVTKALGAVDWAQLGAEVVVVDNLSSAGERGAMRRIAEQRGWHFVGLETNAGFGAGVNAGFAAARGLGCDVFLTVNPDASLTAEVAAQLCAHSRREPLSLLAPTVRTPAGAVEFQGAFLDLRTGAIVGNRGLLTASDGVLRLEEIEAGAGTRDWRGWLTGACVVLHRELLDRVGGFDESLFLYWEDVELSYRCRLAGASLVVRTDLDIVHDEGGTQGVRRGRAKSNGYYRYNTRNRLAFAALHLPRRRLLRWLLATPRASWAILMRGGRRQLLDSRAPLYAALRGSVEGIALAGPALLRPAPAPPREPTGTGRRPAPRSTVAVLTYRREGELDGLLPMLAAQATAARAARGGREVQVLVVDNDPQASAADTVAALDLPGVRYVCEPAPGIANARNRALDEAADSDVIVFIDDDERPADGWLATLLDTYERDDAAAVVGAVVPDYQVPPEPWIEAGRFFVRPRQRTGTEVAAAASSNLLIDLGVARRFGLRFDPAFGITGGEDTLFTRTLTSRGERIVWCDEAVVADRVPAARLTRRWVLQRAYSSGNSASRVALRLADGAAARARQRLRLAGAGGLRMAGGTARWGYGVLSRSLVHRARGLRAAARGAGILAGAVGHAYEEYRRA